MGVAVGVEGVTTLAILCGYLLPRPVLERTLILQLWCSIDTDAHHLIRCPWWDGLERSLTHGASAKEHLLVILMLLLLLVNQVLVSPNSDATC